MDLTDILTTDSPGKKYLLLGNEAIARGAIEAGLEVAATYPGTPSSEIGDSLHRVAMKYKQPFFQYSTNEKVALEVAGAAAIANARAMFICKSVDSIWNH